MAEGYSIPGHVKDYIQERGYQYPATDMAPYIELWYSLLKANGEFWDWDEVVQGVHKKGHRRTIHPAARVANEWASLLMNEDTEIVCEEQACTEWLNDYYTEIGFRANAQGLVKRAFALGTGAWALWLDTSEGVMQVRRYDARMIVPLSWDDDGITECGFCTRATYGNEEYDQLQIHRKGEGGYVIETRIWTTDGDEASLDGVVDELETYCETPTFAIVRPAIENTRVDLSPYGESVYADAVEAMQAVDGAFDAIHNEIDLAKMRIFISDMLVEYTTVDNDGNEQKRKNALPFGNDNTVFRKVQSVDDYVKEFAPSMRTASQIEAYRMAVQTMGDLCGFGLKYFDIDNAGGMKTATEVSSDNSALMRNIKKHENLLENAVAQISKAVLHCARHFLGAALPDEGAVTVNYDDSIIQGTASEKAADLAEVGLTLNAWEYRMKWYGEDEETARANVPGAVSSVDAAEF